MRIIKTIFYYIFVFYVALSLLIVFYDLSTNLEISESLAEKLWDGNEKVVAIITPDRVGERQQAQMVKKAAENLGYKAYIYCYNDVYAILLYPYKLFHTILIKGISYLINPVTHLAISAHVNVQVPSPKVMYIGVSPEYFLKKFSTDYPEVKNYDFFIDINMLNEEFDWLSQILQRKINRKAGIIGVPATNFAESRRNKLLLFGSLWGRKTESLTLALKNLSIEKYMYFMEDKDLILGLEQKSVPRNKNYLELISQINHYGIGLCLHTPYHINAKIPGSRIFEIISSGAIAISDENPFVEKYFGNNVLYFDQNKSAEEIFKKIDRHVKWVQTHSKEAEQKARSAHSILQKEFTTEKFVKTLLDITS